jgi:hypothetical protein
MGFALQSLDRLGHYLWQVSAPQEQVDDRTGMSDESLPFSFARRDAKTVQQADIGKPQHLVRIAGIGGQPARIELNRTIATLLEEGTIQEARIKGTKKPQLVSNCALDQTE